MIRATSLSAFSCYCHCPAGGDYYLVANDFPAYLDAQNRVDAAYRDLAKWTKMSIMSTAGSGEATWLRCVTSAALVRAARAAVPGDYSHCLLDCR